MSHHQLLKKLQINGAYIAKGGKQVGKQARKSRQIFKEIPKEVKWVQETIPLYAFL